MAAVVMLAVLGRKNVDIGDPIRISDLPPLMYTDTAALQDMVKIQAHYAQWKKKKAIVTASLGDGQSCLTMSYLKRHWPELYKCAAHRHFATLFG